MIGNNILCTTTLLIEDVSGYIEFCIFFKLLLMLMCRCLCRVWCLCRWHLHQMILAKFPKEMINLRVSIGKKLWFILLHVTECKKFNFFWDNLEFDYYWYVSEL